MTDMNDRFYINPEISKATTLPVEFYRDPNVFNDLNESVFERTWQFIGDQGMVPLSNYSHPFTLLEEFVSEPLLLTRDEKDDLHCLSNVCTHRANLVSLEPGKVKKLICGYHGRRFKLNGEFDYMPEFKEARDFPQACDHLRKVPLIQWGPFLFCSLQPSFDLKMVIDRMEERIGFLPLDQFKFEPGLSRDYLVKAHWALYCDNYLEGFHVPFVHEGLNKVLNYEEYSTEIYQYCNLQIGYADGSEDCFDLPEGHPDHGKHVAAYYYWIFPNLMLNFYPWGLSVNIVKPIGPQRTRVSFLSYVYDPSKLHSGAGSSLDKVEREDEFVVENVQRGMASSIYQRGRFSPKMEKGVHHFHLLLSRFLSG